MTEESGRPESWSRLWEVFDRALEVEDDQRAAFLDDACGSDDELRREVEKYLAAHGQGRSPLDRSPLESSLPTERFDLSSRPDLARGSLIAERFEIVRSLGHGGMGEVYEARDRELDMPVALKTLRGEMAPSMQARERFRREIQLAKQVTHPNVCRIYDLFRHQDEQLFLSMEFLEGGTLAQHLADSGPLEPSEVLPIAEQIAAGLDAAHAVGVIHRDLKTGNVMLVPGSGATRAVVTDFGLARTASPDPESAEPEPHRLTQTGQVLGTPAFMAPEQLEGGDVTAATDVYALGVMLFEMVTGELPFSGDTPYSVVAKRLQSEAPSPRRFTPELDRSWERVILRCLARKPEDRYQRASDVVAALRGETEAKRRARQPTMRWAVVVVSLALLLTVGTILAPRLLAPKAPAAAEALGFEERDWVLIADFDNRTEDAVLDGSVEAALTRELANSSFMNVVPRARVNDALQLMRQPLDTDIRGELAREVALRDGNIRAVLTGTVQKLGATYLLGVDLVDPSDGLVVASVSEEAESLDAVPAAVRQIAGAVRSSLGEALPSVRRSEQQLQAVSTPSLRALQLYSQADRLFANSDARADERDQTAEQLLRDAIAEDPTFASAYTHLAYALVRQNAPAEQVLLISQKAMDLIEHAGPAERYFIRGSHLRFQDDWQEATEQFRALLELQPDHFWANMQIGFHLGSIGRSVEGTDYYVRGAATRPNQFGRVLGAAFLLVTRQGRLAEGQEWAERAWSLYEQLEDPPDFPNPAWTRLLPAHRLWIDGDVEGTLREVDQIVDSLPSQPPNLLQEMADQALFFYLDLGMLQRAGEIQAMFAPLSPETWARVLAWRQRDVGSLREILRLEDESDPATASGVALSLAQLGYTADAEQLLARLPEEVEPPDVNWDSWEGPVFSANLAVTRGTVAAQKGRLDEAIPLLEEGLALMLSRRLLGEYFIGTMTLATAMEDLDRPGQAIELLEEASLHKARVMWGRHYWLALRLRQAQTLRRHGRDVEAAQVEEELGRHLAYADEDFSLLRELRLQQDLQDIEVERRN